MISFPLAAMGFTRQMLGPKTNNPQVRVPQVCVPWSVLGQTKLHVQVTFYIFREGWCFHYALVITKAWHNETKNSPPKPHPHPPARLPL